MKTLDINGETFPWEVGHYHVDTGHGSITRHNTIFYSPTIRTVKYKKYWLFGPIQTKQVYDEIFRLPLDITSAEYSKEQIRTRIEAQLYIRERRCEIKAGEII